MALMHAREHAAGYSHCCHGYAQYRHQYCVAEVERESSSRRDDIVFCMLCK